MQESRDRAKSLAGPLSVSPNGSPSDGKTKSFSFFKNHTTSSL